MSLVVRGLKVDRGDLNVLEGVDLEVAQGDFVAVTGPSGCGKSTLLNAVAGLIPISAGNIVAERAALGYVFQRPMLLPWRTALENAAFGLECRGVDPDQAQRRSRSFLERVGLAAFLDFLPHELSEGMKQRVALARAFLVEPTLVLMDEPFSSLDEAARRELQDLVLDLWRQSSCTVIFVSHFLDELAYLADRVVVMGGRPAKVARSVEIDLPRPRGAGNDGMLALAKAVQRCRQAAQEGK